MNKLSILSITVGAAAGFAAGWFICKKKYEKIHQEEIESIKAAFSTRKEVCKCEEEKVEDKYKDSEEEKAELKEVQNKYNKLVEKYGGQKMENDPYIFVISPEEFGEDESFKQISLTYYADGVLADDEGDVYDIPSTVGEYALTQFGEYEDDAVHVRNNRRETDYEVLLDPRKYSEVFKSE